jgi:hypothetical protein
MPTFLAVGMVVAEMLLGGYLMALNALMSR